MRIGTIGVLGLFAFAFALRPAAAGEVGIWQFDEGGGTVVHDSSGNGNTGVLIGANAGTWTAGKHGGGLYFDGIVGPGATLVSFGDKAAFRITNAITMTAWVKSNDEVRDAPILAKEGDGKLSYWFGLFPTRNYGMLLDPDGNQGWEMYDRDNGNIPAGTWTHLASTWDGHTVNHYVNGELVASRGWSGTINESDAPLVIGVNSNYQNAWNGTAFKGWLDDVRLYNTALDANGIRGTMSPVPEPTVVARWLSLAAVGAVVAWRWRRRAA